MKYPLAAAMILAGLFAAAPAFAACTTATSPNTSGVTANATYEAVLAVCDNVGGAATPLGFQRITSLSAATALSVPTGATVAVITPETQAVRWRDDGTNPTATVGFPIATGQPLTVRGATALAAIKFIEQTASASLDVSYYQ